MSETKDYSLLRPFDQEEAKRGEKLCDRDHANEYEFVAEGTPRATGESIAVRLVKSIYNKNTGWLYLCGPEDLRMAPIWWVEGRPVYRGDVLWYKGDEKVVASKPIDSVGWATCEDGIHRDMKAMSWTPPKVKRDGWVNIYKSFCQQYAAITSEAHKTKAQADSNAGNGRTACVRIEWEEPAEVAK